MAYLELNVRPREFNFHTLHPRSGLACLGHSEISAASGDVEAFSDNILDNIAVKSLKGLKAEWCLRPASMSTTRDNNAPSALHAVSRNLLPGFADFVHLDPASTHAAIRIDSSRSVYIAMTAPDMLFADIRRQLERLQDGSKVDCFFSFAVDHFEPASQIVDWVRGRLGSNDVPFSEEPYLPQDEAVYNYLYEFGFVVTPQQTATP